jgi:hypothetical protein
MSSTLCMCYIAVAVLHTNSDNTIILGKNVLCGNRALSCGHNNIYQGNISQTKAQLVIHTT